MRIREEVWEMLDELPESFFEPPRRASSLELGSFDTFEWRRGMPSAWFQTISATLKFAHAEIMKRRATPQARPWTNVVRDVYAASLRRAYRRSGLARSGLLPFARIRSPDLRPFRKKLLLKEERFCLAVLLEVRPNGPTRAYLGDAKVVLSTLSDVPLETIDRWHERWLAYELLLKRVAELAPAYVAAARAASQKPPRRLR